MNRILRSAILLLTAPTGSRSTMCSVRGGLPHWSLLPAARFHGSYSANSANN